ncbi:hypothetical protein MYSE111917_20340 [Mycobacterium senriense]
MPTARYIARRNIPPNLPMVPSMFGDVARFVDGSVFDRGVAHTGNCENSCNRFRSHVAPPGLHIPAGQAGGRVNRLEGSFADVQIVRPSASACDLVFAAQGIALRHGYGKTMGHEQPGGLRSPEPLRGLGDGRRELGVRRLSTGLTTLFAAMTRPVSGGVSTFRSACAPPGARRSDRRYTQVFPRAPDTTAEMSPLCSRRLCRATAFARAALRR